MNEMLRGPWTDAEITALAGHLFEVQTGVVPREQDLERASREVRLVLSGEGMSPDGSTARVVRAAARLMRTAFERGAKGMRERAAALAHELTLEDRYAWDVKEQNEALPLVDEAMESKEPVPLSRDGQEPAAGLPGQG